MTEEEHQRLRDHWGPIKCPIERVYNSDHIGMKFDVTISNPPYTGVTKDSKVWKSMMKAAFTTTNPGGYVMFVTPPGWLRPSTPLYGLVFIQNEVLSVNVIDGRAAFGVATNAAFFVTHVGGKRATHFDYKICDHPTTRVPNDGSFLPQMPCDMEVLDLLKITVNSGRKPIVLNSNTGVDLNKLDWSPIKTAEYCYPNFVERPNTVKKKKKPVNIVWTKSALKDALVKKVICWRTIEDAKQGRIRLEVNDTHGIINAHGDGHTHMLINEVQTEEGIKSYLYSKLVRLVLKPFITYVGTPVEILRRLPLIDLSRSWTDAELYKLFELSPSLIAYVEKTMS